MSPEQTKEKQPAVLCRSDEASCDGLDAQLSGSWLRLAIAAVFAGQGMVFSLAVNLTPPPYASIPYWGLHGGLIFSALVVIFFLGRPLFASTWRMLRNRRLSIEGLFTLSLTGAFVGSCISSVTGQGSVYYEVVAVVIAIYTVGRMLGERSQTLLHLQSEELRERFDAALLVNDDGSCTPMPLSELIEGCRVQVRPGAPITVDGVIVSGSGYVRETALSGEPLPVVRHPGDRVRAGTWSEDGLFEVEAEALEGERELDRILETVEDVSGRPSELQSQANQLIQSFLPLVVGVSVATAIYWSFMGTWVDAVLNSMAVLLVACPCALGLATPVAIWQGLFCLARRGLVSRDGALIDALARTRHLYFDKTGTLSESGMRLTEVYVVDAWQSRRAALLGAVRLIESKFQHPVARTLCAGIDSDIEDLALDSLEVVAGKGVVAQVDVGDAAGPLRLSIGETSLGAGRGQDEVLEAAVRQLRESEGKRVYVFAGADLAAIFVLRESPRPGINEICREFERLQVRASVLTGDSNVDLRLPESMVVERGLSAMDKADRVLASKERGECPVLVGDGINDTSAMASADASIAMGGGVPIVRTVASGQLRDEALSVLPEAIHLCRRIHRDLRLNLIYAAVYNSLGMLLAAAGLLHPVAAAVIMLASSFFVSFRALRSAR